MLQLHYNWNVVEPILSFSNDVSGIELRGWQQDNPVAVPPEIIAVIRSKEVKALSVGAISYFHCPSRRDLYLDAKARIKGSETWGRIAGRLAERFLIDLVSSRFNKRLYSHRRSYQTMRRIVERRLRAFRKARSPDFDLLDKYKTSPAGDPLFFAGLLRNVGIHELAAQELDFLLRAKKQRRSPPVETHLTPAEHLGFSKTTAPDFIFPDLKTVGDMKTGSHVEPYHFLTCAGYALAYESQEKQPVDFGMIYFFPTHRTAVAFAQVYMFVIDDELRKRFLLLRNQAYTTLLAANPPEFPADRQNCPTCKYLSHCEANGLKVR